MINFDDIKKFVRWVTRGITPNRFALILLIAFSLDVLVSDTYTSQNNYIAILKQLEKLEHDKKDFKYTDIQGLYDICRDPRYLISKEITRSESEKANLDRACKVITKLYDNQDIKDLKL